MIRLWSRTSERVRAADARQELQQRVDRVRRRLVGEERGQELRVGRRGEAGAAALELVEQLAGVDEVAVVADRDRPPRPEPERRLGVLPDRRAGRRVAAVGDREVAAEAGQPPLVEDLGDHPEVLVQEDLGAVADGEAGRFLAAVLEREQAGRGDRRGLRARSRAAATTPNDAAHSARSRPAEPRPSRGRAAGRAPRRARGRRARRRSRPRRASRAPRPRRSRRRRRARRRSRSPPTVADRLDRQAVLAREQLDRRRRGAAVPRRRARLGLSPNRSTAGELETGSRTCAPSPAPHRRLGERHREPAARDVLRGREQAARDGLDDERLEPPLAVEVEGRRAVLGRDAGDARVLAARRGPGPASPTRRIASPAARNAGPIAGATSSSRPTTPICGRRRDPAARRLVVQRDVAAGDGQAERAARVAEAADRLACSCQNASGRVGSPKFRQFVTPSGRAPVIATLRVASATLIAAPSQGSAALTPALPSVAATRRLRACPSTRRTAAPRPGPGDRGRPGRSSRTARRPPGARRDSAIPGAPAARRPGPSPAPAAGRSRRSGAPGAGASAPPLGRRGEPLVDDRVGRQGAAGMRASSRRRARPAVVEPALDDGDVAVVGHAADHRARQAPARADLGDVVVAAPAGRSRASAPGSR